MRPRAPTEQRGFFGSLRGDERPRRVFLGLHELLLALAEGPVVASQHVRALGVEPQTLDENAREERDDHRRDEGQQSKQAPGW